MYFPRDLSLFALCCSVSVPSIYTTSCNVPVKNPDHQIHPLFVQRQSKYSLQRKQTSKDMATQLNSLLEAARWAPSSYNNQPWRFIYGVHGTPAWDKLFSVLVPFNQEWVSNAGALILVISKKTSDTGKPAPTHSFDTGLAASQLIIEATHRGLVAHPMNGFDYDKARALFAIPQEYTLEAMIALGEVTPKGKGRKEFLERDTKQGSRKKLSEIAFEGMFPAKN